MRVSLVTTCFNEIDSLLTWKDDVLRQSKQPDEICIVDAVSQDGTTEKLAEWAEEDPRIKVVAEKCSPARGRNLAVRLSTSDIVASTDMGCRIDPEWLESLCKPFEDSSVSVVAGNFGPDMDSISSAAAWAAYYLSAKYVPRLGPGFFPSNRSVAYRRQAWDCLGGLPEDLSFASDDTVMGLLLMHSDLKVAYAPGAVVRWGRHGRLRDYWREAYRYLYGNGQAGIVRGSLRPLLSGRCRRVKAYPLALLSMFCPSTVRCMFKALREGHLQTFVLVPVLRFGLVLNYSRGFIAGEANGERECRSCRCRLRSVWSDGIPLNKGGCVWWLQESPC